MSSASNAAPRWSKTYMLDLHDKYDFPGFENLPPAGEFKIGGTTCTILEILDQETRLGRPAYVVKDRDGKELLLACCYEDLTQWPSSKCAVGNLIAVRDTKVDRFPHRKLGFGVEDPSQVSFLQCSRERLHELNEKLFRYEQNCTACNKPNCKMACAKCKSAYCSQQCQKSDWTARHKRECAVVQQLRDWNEVEDWR